MARKKKIKLDEAFLKSHGANRFAASRNWRNQEIEERWVKSNRLYDSEFAPSSKKGSDVLLGQGRLFIPKTYTHLQRILVDVLETFFFDPEEIVSVSSWKGVPADKRLVVKTLLNYRLNSHPIDFYMEAYEACLDAIRNKIGVMEVYPRLKDDGKKTKFTPIINTLPFEDVFFDQTATWKNYHQKTIIKRMLRPMDHLKRQGYKNLDLLQPVVDAVTTERVKDQRARSQGTPFSDKSDVPAQDNTYIYQIWTHLDIDNTGFLESVSYMMGGSVNGPEVVISNVEKNNLPYLHEGEDYVRPPIVVGSAFPESHKMYGKDLPEIVEGLQRETNALRNQRREAVALALRPPIMVTRGQGIDLMGLVNRRVGGVVLGDDVSPASVRELDVRDVTASSYREEAVTNQDYAEATSIPPNLLGFSAPGEQSATESASQSTNANKKIAMIIKNLSQTLFVPAFNMLLRLEQEYETTDFIRKVVGNVLGEAIVNSDGEATIKSTKEIIQGDFELKASVGINKQAQLNKFMLLMDRANQANASTANLVQLGVVKPEDAKFVDVMAIFERMLPLLNEKDIEDFTIQAQPAIQQGGQALGVASQAGGEGDVGANVVNMNPGVV